MRRTAWKLSPDKVPEPVHCNGCGRQLAVRYNTYSKRLLYCDELCAHLYDRGVDRFSDRQLRRMILTLYVYENVTQAELGRMFGGLDRARVSQILDLGDPRRWN